MATVNSTDSGAPPGQAGDSGGPQQLLKDIKDTKGELVDVKKEIKDLNKRLSDGNFEGDVRYSSAEKVEAELKELKAEKARLQDLLIQYETRLTAQQQQQQSDAGASTCLLISSACSLACAYKCIAPIVRVIAAAV